jgi:predicted dehydrogenase
VADLAEDRRAYVRGLYPGVDVSDQAEAVCQDPEIHAVVIATPVATHFDLAMQSLEAGKHVLVEKPLATTVKEVDVLGKEAEKRGLVLMVGHTFLYNEAVRYIKRVLESGEMGEVRYIYSQRLNLGRIRSDVDALWNFGPHDISIIQYWLDDPTPISIQRFGQSFIQEGIDDVVFLNLRYPGEVIANIHVSWLDPHRVRTMTVVGSKKMIVYDDVAENKIAIYDKGIDRMAVLGQNMDYDNQHFQAFNHRSGDVLMPKINFKEPLKVEIDHFFDCIEKGIPCLTGVDHARKVLEILSP